VRIVTFKLPDKLLEDLDLQALKEGRPRSEVLRDAIKNYLSSSSRPHLKFRVKRIVLT